MPAELLYAKEDKQSRKCGFFVISLVNHTLKLLLSVNRFIIMLVTTTEKIYNRITGPVLSLNM